MPGHPLSIRAATPADWPTIDAIETAADSLFDAVIELPAGPPRSAMLMLPGFVLVADLVGRPVGFAHVLDFDGRFHLEQLSVHPDAQRLGVGAAMLAAAEAAVRDRGGSVLTLRTFADVPWNAPFYRRHGYRDADLPVALQPLLEAEQRAGLPTAGPRVTLAKQVAQDVVPWPAVSVLPLRDGPDGLEVLVQFRAATMDFAAGAVVFPGGRLDAGEQAVEVPSTHLVAWAATGLPAPGLLAAAAIREVAEECGVLLTAADLLPWDDWVTPPGGGRRFDVAFYLTAARAGQHWRNTTTEAVRADWQRPDDVLAEAARGLLRLMPPTHALLTELAALPDVATALALSPAIVPVLHDSATSRPRQPAPGA
ncbi:MAG: GNAT family N-acetyltransferase [Micropruina sp.]|nr:GNAT family N-acetyltransferase [Micropruina sp.]